MNSLHTYPKSLWATAWLFGEGALDMSISSGIERSNIHLAFDGFQPGIATNPYSVKEVSS